MGIDSLFETYRMSVTTAESCTGGLVASALVDIPGISSYFKEGYVTYAPESKERLLHVPQEVIAEYGVVSEETARAMAEGAAEKACADCAIATTGVAGPGGGSKKTPVGTVCFGCVVDHAVFSTTHCFAGTRAQVRHAAADYALAFLEDCIRHEKGGTVCES